MVINSAGFGIIELFGSGSSNSQPYNLGKVTERW